MRPSRRKVNAKPVATVTPSEDDPLKGKWSLADATESLKGTGALLADLEIELPKGKGEKGETGKLTCALFEDRAPLTVANFVGLARGIRPWKTPEGKWAKKAAYDGTVFHRIIKGFMIQGGDALGTGTGEPGYVIPDEVWEDANHDRPGLLCMANRGPNTNGAQFFITDAAAAHLDSGYTIFGECAPVELVHKIASTEVKGEKPTNAPKIKKVTIRRGASPLPSSSGAAAAASSSPAAPAAPATDKP
ncbi:MAG: peptidylprolyl isomerase [Myxococcales bacterium]|nr:MAG: peptidylprolyl isomerase [Myxococcales bacterium]